MVITVDKPPNWSSNGNGKDNNNASIGHKTHLAVARSDGAATKDDTHVGDEGRPSGDGSVAGTNSVTRLREGECTAKDCRVLMTGCGRSGTHFIAEQLADAGMLCGCGCHAPCMCHTPCVCMLRRVFTDLSQRSTVVQTFFLQEVSRLSKKCQTVSCSRT